MLLIFLGSTITATAQLLGGMPIHSKKGGCANQGTATSQDFDCDGVINSIDIDDDNDGILDIDEDRCNLQYYENFGNINGVTNLATAGLPGSTTAMGFGGDDGLYAISNRLDPFIGNWWNGNALDPINPNVGGVMYVNAGANNVYTSPLFSGWAPGVTYKFSFRIFVSSPTPSVSFDILNSGGGVIAQVFTGNLGSAESGRWLVYESSFTMPAGVTTGRFKISNYNGAGMGQDYTIDELRLWRADVVCDTDGDGVPNSLDVDSDGDGCNDVVESGGIDANNDGKLDGTGFGVSGLVTGGTGGYNGLTLTNIETKAQQLTINTAPGSQTVAYGMATSFTIVATEKTAVSYASGTPNYNGAASTTSGLVYQWYDGNPASGGVALTNAFPYSNVTTATLNILNSAGLNGKQYFVRIGSSNVAVCPLSASATLTVNPQIDTDGDGIIDEIDLDDDNDGILDSEEQGFGAITASARNGVIVTMPSNISRTFHPWGVQSLQGLVDGDDGMYNVTINGSYSNQEILRLEFPESRYITSFGITQMSNQMIQPGSTFKIQGSNNTTTWTDVTGTLSWPNNLMVLPINFPTNNALYKYYRMYAFSVSGSGAGWFSEITFNQKSLTTLDSDNDGIVNSMDTDADADGCFDGIEGGASFTVANLTAGRLTGGVDANGVPTIATATGQTIGTSQSSTLNACINSDNDGIVDVDDLDDDNDGILDANETTCLVLNLTPNTSSANYINSGNWPDLNQPMLNSSSSWSGASNTSTTQFVGMNAGSPYKITGVRTQGRGDAGQWVASYELQGTKNGTTWVAIGTFTGNTDQNTTIYRAVTNTDADWTGFRIRPLTWNGHPSMRFQFELCNPVDGDTDGNGIVNRIDLDSDGDGCFDAIEGDADFTAANLTAGRLTGGVNANGIPTVATASGQTIGTSQNGTLNACVDSDNDGVANTDDLDDDNDGVLDSEEGCFRVSQINAEFNGTFGTLTGATTNKNLQTPANGGYAYSYPNNAAAQYAVVNATGSNGWHPSTLIFDDIKGHTTGTNEDAFLVVNGGTSVGVFYAETFNVSVASNYQYGLWAINAVKGAANVSEPGAEIGIRIINTATSAAVASISTGLLASGNTPQWTSASSTVTLPVGTYRLEVFNITVTSGGNDFAIDDIIINQTSNLTYSCQDTDNDGIANSLDLDADGDGCFDVTESGGTDANNNGILDGTGISTQGLVTGGTGGYNGLSGTEYVGINVACASGSFTTAVSPSVSGGLTNGTAYTGTYSIPFTGGSGCTLPAETITQSGLTLSYAGGTIGASGNLVYTLSGSYTGTSGGFVTFTTKNGCVIYISMPKSCNEIKLANASATDGVYTIDPDGSGSAFGAMQAYCDMTTDGGGWTLIGVNGAPSNFSTTGSTSMTNPNTGAWLNRNIVIALATNSNTVQLRAGNSSTSFAHKATSTSNGLAIAALRNSSTTVAGPGTWHNGASGQFTVNTGTWGWSFPGSGISVSIVGWPLMYHASNNPDAVHWFINNAYNRTSTGEPWSATFIK